MALKVEYLPLNEIAAYERNARLHSAEQIQQLVNSIREFGFTNPILIDSNSELIAGHGRLAAAIEIGMDKVPAIRLDNLSEKQIKALRITDNQLALNATWDLDLLAAELSELDGADFDLELLGFDDDFLNGLLLDDPDEIPSDGSQEEAIDEAAVKVEVLIGPYKCSVDKHDWDKWETRIRAEVGFDRSDIEKEIKKKLGF